MKGMKKKLEEAEASVKGEKWVAEVVSSGGAFKSLEEWKDLFEPIKHESERSKHVKAKVLTKAKDTILTHVHVGMSKKLYLTILEGLSIVATKLEQDLLQPEVKVPPMVPKLLNSMNGIILSYRFGKNKKTERKFAHIRKVACDGLIDLLVQESKNLALLQANLRKELRERRPTIEGILSRQLDSIVESANRRFDQKVESSFSEQLAKLDLVGSTADAVLQAAGIQRPGEQEMDKLVEKAEEMTEKAQEMKEKKDEVVHDVAVVIKNMLLSKVEPLAQVLTHVLDNLLVVFTLAMHKVQNDATSRELHLTMEEFVESRFVALETLISDDIHKLTDTIGAMMQKKIDDEDEDDDVGSWEENGQNPCMIGRHWDFLESNDVE